MFLEFCSNWLRLITLCKNVTLFWSCGPDWTCQTPCYEYGTCIIPIENNHKIMTRYLKTVAVAIHNIAVFSVYKIPSFCSSWDQKDCETVMVDPRGEVYVVSKVTGAPVAQWVKRWPADLVVPSSRRVQGEIFSSVNVFHCAQHSLSTP